MYEEKLHETLVITEDEFSDQLYETLAKILQTLFQARYECRVFEEECGIIVIQYNHHPDKQFGNPHLRWVEDHEDDLLDDCRGYAAESSTTEVPDDLKGFVF